MLPARDDGTERDHQGGEHERSVWRHDIARHHRHGGEREDEREPSLPRHQYVLSAEKSNETRTNSARSHEDELNLTIRLGCSRDWLLLAERLVRTSGQTPTPTELHPIRAPTVLVGPLGRVRLAAARVRAT